MKRGYATSAGTSPGSHDSAAGTPWAISARLAAYLSSQSSEVEPRRGAAEQHQLVVDGRHHQTDAFAEADLQDGVDVVGRAGQRHAIRAVGGVHGRRQRIDVGDDDGAAAMVGDGALEGAHQGDPA
jgi:hypothetical protein